MRNEDQHIVFGSGLKGAKVVDSAYRRSQYGFSLGRGTPFYHLKEVPGARSDVCYNCGIQACTGFVARPDCGYNFIYGDIPEEAPDAVRLPTPEERCAADPHGAPVTMAPVAFAAGEASSSAAAPDAWADWSPSPPKPGDVGRGYASAGGAGAPTVVVASVGVGNASADGSAASSSTTPPNFPFGNVAKRLPAPPPLAFPEQRPGKSYTHGVARGEARNPPGPYGEMRSSPRGPGTVLFGVPS